MTDFGKFGLKACFGGWGFNFFLQNPQPPKQALEAKFSKFLERKKLKAGGVFDFTGGFGLKVRQVSAGFGCGEGY